MRAAEFMKAFVEVVRYLDKDEAAETSEKIDDNVGTFTPPLQAKIELLKKANNVTSVYDKNDPTVTQTSSLYNKFEAADDDGPFEG